MIKHFLNSDRVSFENVASNQLRLRFVESSAWYNLKTFDKNDLDIENDRWFHLLI